MIKVLVFIVLFVSFIIYSVFVYTVGTNNPVAHDKTTAMAIDKGKHLFQSYNCVACHQLYGLGGFLGPDLTTAWSDPQRGENYIRSFLKHGGQRMPKYNLNHDEINNLVSFLKYVDTTAITYKYDRASTK